MYYGAFKSCRIHRIYELNAHERHHKVVITSGKLEIFFKPRVSELGACQWKNVSDAMDAAKDKMCSVGKVVEMNKMIIFCNVQ